MKFIITESQYKILLEKSYHYNVDAAYNKIIEAVEGWGTNPDKILSALDLIESKKEFMELLLKFEDKKTGYDSFENMVNKEYDMTNYNDIIKLEKKLKDSFGVTSTYSSGKSKIGGFNLFFQNFKISVPNYEFFSACKAKWGSLLDDAKNFWIAWLSNPATKSKFKKNWINAGEKTINVDYIFNKYIEAINKIDELVYYDNTDEVFINFRDATAFVTGSYPTKIFINCSKNGNEPLNTLIHEMQHILFNIKPLNPNKQISDVFGSSSPANYPKKILTGDGNVEKLISPELISISAKYGVKPVYLQVWLTGARSVNTVDKGYVCEETEKMSNIMSIRKKFNIKPGENLTFEMLKPYILLSKKDVDINWLLWCWAERGFEDIEVFLGRLNELAFQYEKSEDNDLSKTGMYSA